MPAEGAQAKRSRAAKVVEQLLLTTPEARSPLHHRTAVDLLVACILLDGGAPLPKVNRAAARLQSQFRNAAAYADQARAIGRLLGSFPGRADRAKRIARACRSLWRQHGGLVPSSREALARVPGVGAAAAGLFVLYLGTRPAFPVDERVLRAARRLGLTKPGPAAAHEKALLRLLPKGPLWPVHQALAIHADQTCKAPVPRCTRCPVQALCPKVGVAAELEQVRRERARRRPRRKRRAPPKRRRGLLGLRWF